MCNEEGKKTKDVGTAYTAIFGCVTLWHIELTEKMMIKDTEKHDLKHKKWSSSHYSEPVNTCDTVVRVHSVLRCAKNQNCTHTRDTRFGFTAGLPVPVFNPKDMCTLHDRWMFVKDLLRELIP